MYTLNIARKQLIRPLCGKQPSRLKWSEVPNMQPPKKIPELQFPERRRLKMMDKTPQIGASERPRKTFKAIRQIRGPELVHTTLYHKQYGIRALAGGYIRHGHFEMMRSRINRNIDESRMFAMWRVDAPWKSVTKKGQGHRMGGGKASIHHYHTPVKAGRIVLEVAGNCEFDEVRPMMQIVAQNLPFPADVVSEEMLEEEKTAAARAAERNMNPFTFQYCAQHNMLGISKWLSPFDYIWHNKYR